MSDLLLCVAVACAFVDVVFTRRVVMVMLQELQAAVAKTTSVQESAVALLVGLHAKLSAAAVSEDPAAVQAVLDQLQVSTDALAAAVAENTDPAPPVAEPPVADPVV